MISFYPARSRYPMIILSRLIFTLSSIRLLTDYIQNLYFRLKIVR